MSKKNAIIFDLDGLLLDTERIALDTFLTACREHDFKPDLSVYYRVIGTNGTKTKEIFLEGFGKEFPYDAIQSRWVELYHRETWYKPVPVRPGALGLVRNLEKRATKLAVVTSSRREIVLKKLTNAGLLSFFPVIVAGDEIANSKPHPEGYLKACGLLNEEPRECLALEDSDNGVRAATAAGLTVIQVPDLLPPSPEVRALGHRVMASLAEVEELVDTGLL